MDPKEVGDEGVDCIELAQNNVQSWTFVNVVLKLWVS
jgi:hypothetical protein